MLFFTELRMNTETKGNERCASLSDIFYMNISPVQIMPFSIKLTMYTKAQINQIKSNQSGIAYVAELLQG